MIHRPKGYAPERTGRISTLAGGAHFVFLPKPVPAMPAQLPKPEPSSAARRWVELSEHIVACGRFLRAGFGAYAAGRRLSEAQWSLLWAFLAAAPGGMNQTEVAAVLAVSPAHVSGLVEPLRRQGLLSRQRRVRDRRQRVWRLAPAGCAVLEQVLADAARWTAGLEARMGHEPTDELLALLPRLRSALRNEHGGAPAGPPLKPFPPAPDEPAAPGPEAQGGCP
jgi:DNA-binding MarR family transcriptional regulator